MKNLILILAFLIGGFSVSAQWAEDFDGKTNLDLEAECWSLEGTHAYTHNGLSCGLTASTSVVAAAVDALATPDSLTLTTPQYVDSGTVFFDYTMNAMSKGRIYLRILNRGGNVVDSYTLLPDTTINTMTVDVGPLNSLELTFSWLAFAPTDTIFVDDFISTVDVAHCGVFAIEPPEPDKPLDAPTGIKPTNETYMTMMGKYVSNKPVNELFVLRETYSYRNLYDQKYIKQFVIQ